LRSGDRNIGHVRRLGDGVYFFTKDEISWFLFPAAGEIGTAGRNTFRGPRLFNIYLSLGKRFRLTEPQNLSFQSEAYNLLNNANFANPGVSLATPLTLGKITSGRYRDHGSSDRRDFRGPASGATRPPLGILMKRMFCGATVIVLASVTFAQRPIILLISTPAQQPA
jgi:hypothetical protein